LTAAERSKPNRPDARSVAMHVVERVLFDKAYASAALNAELAKYPQLSSREGAFATEMVYTALRCRRALEARLSERCPRGLPKDRVVRAALIVAAAQMLSLDHASVPVAVDAAVTRVRAARGPKPAGFVNALLRQIAAGPPLLMADALRMNVPDWLYEQLAAAVGHDEADALVGIGEAARSHSTDVRIRAGRAIPEWLSQAPAARWLPDVRTVRGLGDLRALSGWQAGDFVVQEQGAQLIAWALDVPEGATVLDVCAGRGQKTTLLAERVGPSGLVWATDLHSHKLAGLQEECERLQLTNVKTLAVDWSVGGGTLPRDLQFALVDAPCTGTGTLYKRPEILDRLGPTDPQRMGELAARIVRNVAKHCQAGAQIVYAVCSVLPEEGQHVIERVADILEPIPFSTAPLRSAAGTDTCQVRLLPLRHGTDGYFVANLRKR
jgi:16S rRNA (cytosine967-C5)-methyltransferase